MDENEIAAAEVDQRANLPVQYQGEPPAAHETRGEFVKFGALVVVFLITFAVIALVAPVVGQVVPAVLGLNGATAVIPDQAIPVEVDQNDTPRPTDEDETEPEDLNGAETNGDETNGGDGANGQNGGEGNEETAAPTPRLHIVQQGQNLTMIALQYGVTVEAITQANNISNPNRIEAGMVFVIP